MWHLLTIDQIQHIMLYGYTWKQKNPPTPEEEKAEEERMRKERRKEIIGTAILHTLLLPILLPVAFAVLVYVGIEICVEKIKEWNKNGWKRSKIDVEKEEWSEPRPKLLSHTITTCRHKLPTLFDRHYVVYVETEYNNPLNSFICNNMEYIRKGFLERNYHFVYIPELKNLSDEDLACAFPLDTASMTDEIRNDIRNITTEQFTRLFVSLIDMDFSGSKAGLLRLELYHGEIEYGISDIDYSKSRFVYVDLQNCCPDNIKKAFEEYFEFYATELKSGLYCVRPREEYPLDDWQKGESDGNQNDIPDYLFYYDQQKMLSIAEEIRQRVEILKQGGYIELLLHTLGADLVKQINDSRKTATPLMHLNISDNLRIFIPELDNREMKMPALARALYVFYLRHEEGVEFKFLSEFTEELFSLYRLASNRLDDSRLRTTVDSLVNPTENKINECVSRIKTAFLSVMDEYAARNYCLQMRNKEFRREIPEEEGKVRLFKDMAKYISLPRHLVRYPDAVRQVPVIKGSSLLDRCLIEEEFDRRLDRMKEAVNRFTNLDNNKSLFGRKKREAEKQRLRSELVEASMAVLEMQPNNFLAHFNLGEAYCNVVDFDKSIHENTMLIEHDAYTWNVSYINRAEAYLYAGEYDRGLADINSYFNSLRRWKEGDEEADRIKALLMKAKVES